MHITPNQKIFAKDNVNFTEKQIQEIIAENPSILWLWDLELKDKERIHEKAGRLDLLLQDSLTKRRYEVELQLWKIDESHIIRTLEYRDIERKRYPQYDHCAVIIAEEITSRFLNVISLFNGHIPLIAIKFDILKVWEHHTISFTKILDEVKFWLVDDDEQTSEPWSRELRIKRGSKETIEMLDQILEIVLKKINPWIQLKYTKHYIGLEDNWKVTNFCIFRPRKKHIAIEFKMERSESISSKIEEAGLIYQYHDKRSSYEIMVKASDFWLFLQEFRSFFQDSYNYYNQ